MGISSLDWHRDLVIRSLARSRMNFETATESVQPLADSGQAEASFLRCRGYGCGVEPRAIVSDRAAHRDRRLPEPNLHRFGVGVFCRVVECLLNHAVQRRFHSNRKARTLESIHGPANLRTPRHSLREIFEGRHETPVVEDGRAEFMCQGP